VPARPSFVARQLGDGVTTEARKLAAILAADVVGFSRLTGADEERTLARLRALRSDLIDPTIAVHKGRVVKRTGDGAIVEFRSVVDAVRCAIEVQNAMVERNSGVPENRRIEFRIGVHLGDVVEEDDGDLMGDGVNIAARLEGVAKPGAICLSEDAYRQVKSRLDMNVSDLGPTALKNIAEPLRVYSVAVGKPTAALKPKPAPRGRLVPATAVLAALLVGAGGRGCRMVFGCGQARGCRCVLGPCAGSDGPVRRADGRGSAVRQRDRQSSIRHAHPTYRPEDDGRRWQRDDLAHRRAPGRRGRERRRPDRSRAAIKRRLCRHRKPGGGG
jgi:class 3 adenylate cyclase